MAKLDVSLLVMTPLAKAMSRSATGYDPVMNASIPSRNRSNPVEEKQPATPNCVACEPSTASSRAKASPAA